jgi:hypothetical protein
MATAKRASRPGKEAPNFAVVVAVGQSESVEARVVGGRVALFLLAFVGGALLACDSTPRTEPEPDDGLFFEVRPQAGRRPEGRLIEDLAPEPEIVVSTAASPIVGSTDDIVFPGRVVLVTVDGVRWEDVFASGGGGLASMPNLARLVHARGVALGGPGCAHDVRASGPNFVSLPGYLEIFGGKRSACTHNNCPPTEEPTILDEAQAAAHRAGDVAVFASWNRYANAIARDRRAIVVSAGAQTVGLRAAKDDDKLRSYLEAGAAHSGYPGWGDYRPDIHTSRIALRYLETVGPRVLVVGLGDADEQGHRGDAAGYRRAIHRTDEFLGDLERTLERMGDDGGRTAVVVTTDHGRAASLRGHGARFPESQRVWLAAFGAGIAHRGVSCASAPLRLAHVAGAIRTLLALEPIETVDGVRPEPGPLAAEILDGHRSAM